MISSYFNLEIDLRGRRRGVGAPRATELPYELTGTQNAVRVNNNSAVIVLVLARLAVGREVFVLRGELVQISGGFRIPDILTDSGARLVEEGKTSAITHSGYWIISSSCEFYAHPSFSLAPPICAGARIVLIAQFTNLSTKSS